jgi:hypothetical protein
VRSAAIRARLVLGILCVAMPHRVLAAIGGRDRDDPRAAVIARVLGARLLVQAGVDAALGPRTRRVDVTVELTHAASMLPAALLWPIHRRSALVSAACGGGVALLDLGRTRVRSSGRTRPVAAPLSQASRLLSRDISRSQRWP